MQIIAPVTERHTPAAAQRSQRDASRACRYPIYAAAALYGVTVAALLIMCFRLTGWHLVYPLDDSYIAIAMAKNFAACGVWGVTSHEFTSATSTPLFVLLLSTIYRITGPLEWIPLAVSCVFGLAVLWAANRIFMPSLSPPQRLVALCAIVVLTPLNVVGVIGMEHTLHIFLVLLFARGLLDNGGRWLPLITSLMVATRYEGLFLLAVAVALLLTRRRWRRAVELTAAGWFPVLIYGAVSVAHGYLWLPNSVAMKGMRVHDLSLAARLHALLVNSAHSLFHGLYALPLLIALTVLAFCCRRGDRALLVLAIGGLAFQIAFADLGWLYRYDGYLIVLSVVAVAIALPSALRTWSPDRTAGVVLLAALPLAMLFARTIQSQYVVQRYARATYLQQYQTARFLHTYYRGASVAVNDIGVINAHTDLSCLDLVGLANLDVLLAKRRGAYTTALIEVQALQRGVSIAIVYDSWFNEHPETIFGGPPLPSSWTRVRRWRIPYNNGETGGDTISFYLVHGDDVSKLSRNLTDFEPSLPAAVIVLPG